MNVHYKTIKKILKYAKGSLYRLNASTAQYYHFSLIREGNKIDWQGGYSWGEKYGDTYLLNLDTEKIT